MTSSCSAIDPLDPIDDITGPVNETITFDELIQRLTQIATRDYAEWRIAASEAGADVGHVSSPEDSSEISDNVMTSLKSWIDSTGYLSLIVHQYTMLSSKMFKLLGCLNVSSFKRSAKMIWCVQVLCTQLLILISFCY